MNHLDAGSYDIHGCDPIIARRLGLFTMHSYPRAPFQCPHCGGVFQIPPDVVGQAVACPHCNGGVLIPKTASTTAPPIAESPAPPAFAEPRQSIDPWQPPSLHPPMPAPVSEPPVVTRPEPVPSALDAVEPPPMTVQPADVSPAPTQPVTLTNDSQNSSRRQFVIPTLDGGQTTIQEPVKTVTVGRRQRQLRGLNSEEKATRRWIKNVIVACFCTGILAILMWWLLS